MKQVILKFYKPIRQKLIFNYPPYQSGFFPKNIHPIHKALNASEKNSVYEILKYQTR